ncbi:MAG: PTS sugar transporter subunit IIA [Micropruina sp.]|nr:PTS sugar transporter subunit IIA [Micropruina sp.]
MKALREEVATAIGQSGLEFNEFALSDLIVHLTVTVDRVQEGNVVSGDEWTTSDRDPLVLALTERLTTLVSDRYGVTLPPSEVAGVYGVVAVRAIRGAGPDAAERVVDPNMRLLVAEIMDDVSEAYLLGPADRTMLLNLALHVQGLVARSRSGVSLGNPLGDEFRNNHPLVHDLALYFAGRLERRLGIAVTAGELDYLTFHMGMQYLRYLEQRDLITITLVVPRYYGMAENLSRQISDTLRGQAVVEDLVTRIDFDPTGVTSDLIVSCVELGERASAPVVLIGLFLRTKDIDHLLAYVRRERERNARRRLRTILTTLIDPTAYFKVDTVESKEVALARMCQALTTAGYVHASFYDDVLDREHRSPTSFGGEFAIPHSMYMDAKATGIAVLVCERGIPWGNSAVRLVFLFALSPDGRQTFRDVLDEITRLLSDSSNITALLKQSSDFDSFMGALVSLLRS